MKKDTQRVEQILAGIKSLRKLVREGRMQGENWEHVEHSLANHETEFSARITELSEHNARVEAKASEPEKPAAEMK